MTSASIKTYVLPGVYSAGYFRYLSLGQKIESYSVPRNFLFIKNIKEIRVPVEQEHLSHHRKWKAHPFKGMVFL
jgi:hypothetical protein